MQHLTFCSLLVSPRPAFSPKGILFFDVAYVGGDFGGMGMVGCCPPIRRIKLIDLWLVKVATNYVCF